MAQKILSLCEITFKVPHEMNVIHIQNSYAKHLSHQQNVLCVQMEKPINFGVEPKWFVFVVVFTLCVHVNLSPDLKQTLFLPS